MRYILLAVLLTGTFSQAQSAPEKTVSETIRVFRIGCGLLEPGDYPADITGNGKSVWITGQGLFDNKLGKQHFTYAGKW
jgi:hypothetical protein